MANEAIRPDELENRAGFEPTRLQALITDLSRLGKGDVELARRAIRFVVDDRDEECLEVIAGLENAAEDLNLAAAPGGVLSLHNVFRQLREDCRPRLLASGWEAEPAAWARLGRVFEAALRSDRSGTLDPPAGWPPWWTVLHAELVAARMKGEATRWPLRLAEAALRSQDDDPDLPLRMLLDEDSVTGAVLDAGDPAKLFSGWRDYLAERSGPVRDALARDDAEVLAGLLRRLVDARFDFAPLADRVAELACDRRKTVRQAAAIPLGGLAPEVVRPALERHLAGGSPKVREQAVRTLHRLLGDGAAETLRRHLESEESVPVRQAIGVLLAPVGDTPTAASPGSPPLPPVLPIETGTIPLPPELGTELRERFRRQHERGIAAWERALDRYRRETEANQQRPPAERHRIWKPERPSAVPEGAITRLLEYVETGRGQVPEVHPDFPVHDLLRPPGIRLAHLVRFHVASGRLQTRHGFHWHAVELDAYRRACPEPRFGLRELALVLAEVGVGPEELSRKVIDERWGWSRFTADWEDDAIWPFFAERPELLEKALQAQAREEVWLHGDRRAAALRILAMFPSPPDAFLALLWEIALGEAKTLRPVARRALASVEGKLPRILLALGDGKQAVRTAAAEWLAELGDRTAIEPLKKAFRSEKQEIVKGSLLAALEALGADLGELFDREALRAEAAKGLAKKLPAGLEWFPFSALPALHWADDGSPVPPEVVRWWVVQAVQRKSPVPGPLLRRMLGLCRPDEAAALARFVVSSWIAHDTHRMSREDATAKAEAEAASVWGQLGSNPYFVRTWKSQAVYRDHLVSAFQGQLLGSATAQKGMLAIAAAAGDRAVARKAERYIREWYGLRLAQCKALLEVLAWNDDPLAIQILLSIANRFRTPAIRKAAEQHVRELADREGWTLDELADRTVPDGGFARETDDEGRPVGAEAVLELDYGPRTFQVRLDDALLPVVERDDGKLLKSLPQPAKGDDAEKAKAARKQFNAAKKTVKDVVKRQTERLYEALCVQRTWRFGDWRRDLADHPIVGRLVTRLVWEVVRDGSGPPGSRPDVAPASGAGAPPPIGADVVARFRPLEDGSLTDARDTEVVVEADATLRLAHSATTPLEEAAAWTTHLEDYDVEPLFPQFGREPVDLGGDDEATELLHRRGWMLSTFRLRGQATKRGWIRGQAEDGGIYSFYRKPFPTLELQAILDFSGSYLPEEDQPAALHGLRFVRLRARGEGEVEWDTEPVPLRRIPPVLLAECAADVAAIAAAGTGFDPEWEGKGLLS